MSILDAPTLVQEMGQIGGRCFVLRGMVGMAVFGIVAWKLQALGEEEQQQLASLLRSKLPARFRKALV